MGFFKRDLGLTTALDELVESYERSGGVIGHLKNGAVIEIEEDEVEVGQIVIPNEVLDGSPDSRGNLPSK